MCSMFTVDVSIGLEIATLAKDVELGESVWKWASAQG